MENKKERMQQEKVGLLRASESCLPRKKPTYMDLVIQFYEKEWPHLHQRWGGHFQGVCVINNKKICNKVINLSDYRTAHL